MSNFAYSAIWFYLPEKVSPGTDSLVGRLPKGLATCDFCFASCAASCRFAESPNKSYF